jgi:hypothetical protein
MNRKARRIDSKKNKGNNILDDKINLPSNPKPNNDENNQKILNLAKDLKTVFDYAKSLEFKLSLITETLVKIGIISFEDIKETQFLYSKKEENKQIKIKQLLSQDLDIEELLNIVTDTPETPGYRRLGIDPIKDLNVNPYELAEFLKRTLTNLPPDEIVNYSRRYGLNESHFGLSTPANIQP